MTPSNTQIEGLVERVKANQVKALSIKQPYPHYIFNQGKDVENLDWPTRGRGWFLVHAGVSKSELDKEDPDDMALPRGGIVGVARIVDCVTEMDSNWFFGRYGFVLRDATAIPLVPCKGQLGFFNVDQQTAEAVALALSSLKDTSS